MSHPLRKWLKDLLQYGRRSIRTPTDGKPPLLWAADLPRLGRMWLGHCWFRTWLDLRSTPPRVTYDPREVFSPHVLLIRPTTLNPVRPLWRAQESFIRLQNWFAEGGPRQIATTLGRGLAGGVFGTAGVVMLAVFGLVGGLLTGLVGLFGASALGTAFGVNALGRGAGTVLKKTRSGFGLLRDGVVGGFTSFAGRFRSPKEIAWTFATVTGTVGLILLMVLHAAGLPGAPKKAQAADAHVVHKPPVQLAQTEAEPADDPFGGFPEDPFGGLPDPFEPAEPPLQPTPVEQSEPQPTEAELEIDIARSGLPPGIARFDLPEDNEEFVVESGAPVLDPTVLPDDDWLLALPRHEIDRQPVIPAAYGETAAMPPDAAPLPEPAEVVDRFTPATRSVGVTVRKTQPAAAETGELLWYDLLVTNHGDEPVAGLVVEERIAEPHRVADARPAAAFKDGVLTWRLDGLGPREERRLSVAVYPMSGDPIATAASVRPVATFSAVTLVQAEEPAIGDPLVEEPPATEPEPIIEPEPTAEPVRRIKLAMTTPERVVDGAACVIRFAVTNTGTVPLDGVVIRGELPEELRHLYGPAVESDLGPIGPGEVKTASLHVTAAAPGEAELIAEVTTAEGITTTVHGSLKVVETLPRSFDPPCDCGPVGAGG